MTGFPRLPVPNGVHLLSRLLIAAAVLIQALPGAHATAPQINTQAPGFCRFSLGDLGITALSDGVLSSSTPG